MLYLLLYQNYASYQRQWSMSRDWHKRYLSNTYERNSIHFRMSMITRRTTTATAKIDSVLKKWVCLSHLHVGRLSSWVIELLRERGQGTGMSTVIEIYGGGLRYVLLLLNPILCSKQYLIGSLSIRSLQCLFTHSGTKVFFRNSWFPLSTPKSSKSTVELWFLPS